MREEETALSERLPRELDGLPPEVEPEGGLAGVFSQNSSELSTDCSTVLSGGGGKGGLDGQTKNAGSNNGWSSEEEGGHYWLKSFIPVWVETDFIIGEGPTADEEDVEAATLA